MKKFITYIFSLLFCVTMFAGCSLIQLNPTKYYSQTVAQIVYDKNNKVNFTMKDLLEAYDNYGYQLQQNDSTLSSEDALKQTAELMVQRYMLVKEIKNQIGELTQGEKNVLMRETYEHINTTLASLEDEIRVEWDRVVNEDDKDEDSSTEEEGPTEYQEYKPTVERVYYEEEVNDVTKYKSKLVRVEEEKEPEDESDPGEFVQNITDADVSAEAWKRYMKTLQKNNEELGIKLSDEKAFEKEINRIYGVLEENKYISKYQEHLTKNLEIDSTSVVESYKQKYKRDYELYSNNESAYHTAMANDASTVYYHPNSGNEYVYVTHVLLGFSDETLAKIKNLEKLYQSNSIEKSVYEAKLKQLQNIETTMIDYYDEKGNKKQISAQLAYEEIYNNVSKYDKDVNFELRAKEFNKYIYKYNTDQGILNRDFAYVVNLDTNVEDQMVKEFADEARRLQKKEGVGAMSEPILTDYGYHIILNLGPVTNVVEYNNIDNLTWEALYNVKTQPSSEKTLFHVEYDALNSDETKVNAILTSLVNDLAAQVEVVNYWEERYLTLLKQQ